MKRSTKKIISYVIAAAVIIGAGFYVVRKSVRFGNVEFTDNAQICRRIVPVNSRVPGYIKEIRFEENQRVKKGDTLVIIDDADLRLELAHARAGYSSATAGRTVAAGGVGVATAKVAVSNASIAEAKALMELAATDLERYRRLLADEAVTRREFDAVETDYKAKRARYETLSRQSAASTSVREESRSRLSQSDAAIELAEAQLATAELNLSYAVITAPCDGFVSRKEIQTGQLVAPGQTLVDIVDTTETWVTANYKETQLHHIAPGSKVEIRVDAYPDIVFDGTVESISGATGAQLSVIPQDNSAGNFVKVRQRVPVRIVFDSDNSATDMERLSAGMNVECLVKY